MTLQINLKFSIAEHNSSKLMGYVLENRASILSVLNTGNSKWGDKYAK